MTHQEAQEAKKIIRDFIKDSIALALSNADPAMLGPLGTEATVYDIPGTTDLIGVKIPGPHGPEYFHIKITRSM